MQDPARAYSWAVRPLTASYSKNRRYRAHRQGCGKALRPSQVRPEAGHSPTSKILPQQRAEKQMHHRPLPFYKPIKSIGF